MKGILDRLQRPVPGERQIGLTRVVAGITGRLDREVLEPRVPEPRKPMFSDKTRRLHPGARPEPNAPQLIRLVRTPFVLSTGYPRREQVMEARPHLERPASPERRPWRLVEED